MITLAALLAALAPYRPTLVGTFPLGLQVEGSDLDVICQARDLGELERVLSTLTPCAPRRIGDASVTTLELAGLPVEVFAQDVAIEQQLGFRHMVIEARLLTLFGAPLHARVHALKRGGMKTEPAFAHVLGLLGDPYRALLTLEPLTEDQLRSRFAAQLMRVT